MYFGLEFVISLLVIIVLAGWLLRKIIPYIIVRWINRQQKGGASTWGGGFDKNYSDDTYRESSEGDIYVSGQNSTQNEKIVDKDMGEYVDFEPIDDDKD